MGIADFRGFFGAGLLVDCSGTVGAGFEAWPTGLMHQIQVEDSEQNPAAQSEFWERTLRRPRIKGQVLLEQRGIWPVARGIRVYLVKHPWQL